MPSRWLILASVMSPVLSIFKILLGHLKLIKFPPHPYLREGHAQLHTSTPGAGREWMQNKEEINIP